MADNVPAGFRLLFRFLPVGFASEIQSLHRFFQAGFQVFLIHWLQQIILAAKLHGFAKKAVFRVAGKHNADHGILAETCIFHGPFHQVKAVFPWHFNVADQNIDRILFQEFLCLADGIHAMYLGNAAFFPVDIFHQHIY